MVSSFMRAVIQRRSQYGLGKDLPLPQDQVTGLIQEAVRHAPSAFNSQSTRAVILYGAHHTRHWSLVKEALRKIVPAESFAATEARIDSFAAGAGTVLFYEDQSVVAGLQKQYALYAENFPIWSEQACGMAQFAVWTALSEAGVGASLQHYNPLADAAIASEWSIPSHWKQRAQMPFGSNQGEFGDKTFIADEERFRVFA